MNDDDKRELAAMEAAIPMLRRRRNHQLELAKIANSNAYYFLQAASVYERAIDQLSQEISDRYERERFLRKKYGD
jgi:hypothetical protein